MAGRIIVEATIILPAWADELLFAHPLEVFDLRSGRDVGRVHIDPNKAGVLAGKNLPLQSDRDTVTVALVDVPLRRRIEKRPGDVHPEHEAKGDQYDRAVLDFLA